MPMAADPRQDEIPGSIREYFAARRFTLVAREDEGVAWVDLLTVGGRPVARGYGRGATVAEAADSARERYIAEQEPAGLT
jgi:hypothetical protein